MARINLRTYTKARESYERGRALRESTPFGMHDHAPASADRPTVVDFMRESNKGRLEHLIDLRVSRMALGPFSFFRGSAGLMAADLAGTPSNGLTAQLCGDAHAANFGLYGSPRGEIVMDINDFDETLVGPWEWDIKRLAASLVLAGLEGGVPESARRKAAEDAVKSYRRTMSNLAKEPFLRSWTALPDASAIEAAEADALLDDFETAAVKARLNTSAKVVAKTTEHIDDHETGIHRHRFIEDPPILTRVSEIDREAVIDGLEEYVESLAVSRQNLITRFGVEDVAFRIVGTGSVGIRSYIALLHGNGDEALVLQLKQARPSALAPYLPESKHKHEGKRIVLGARVVQSAPDILMGWTTIDGLPFMVRQFRNMKGDIDPTALSKSHLDDYGRLAGALLARAHTRSVDPRLLAGYFEDGKELNEAIGEYAVRYARQVVIDHGELVEATQSGTSLY